MARDDVAVGGIGTADDDGGGRPVGQSAVGVDAAVLWRAVGQRGSRRRRADEVAGNRRRPGDVERRVRTAVECQTLDPPGGRGVRQARYAGHCRSRDLDLQDRVGSLRERQRIRRRAGLRIAVDRDGIADGRKGRSENDRLNAASGNVEDDRVGAGRVVRVREGLAQRAGAGVGDGGDGEGGAAGRGRRQHERKSDDRAHDDLLREGEAP